MLSGWSQVRKNISVPNNIVVKCAPWGFWNIYLLVITRISLFSFFFLMIILASNYCKSQHLIVFYRQMARKLLISKGSSECIRFPWIICICILQHLELDVWMKRCPHRGGAIHYTLLQNVTLALFGHIFFSSFSFFLPCGTLVSWTGIKPLPLALEAQS